MGGWEFLDFRVGYDERISVCGWIVWVGDAGLRKLGVDAVEVRKPEQLAGLSGLIIPGGESTTMAKLAEKNKLVRTHSQQRRWFFVFCFSTLVIQPQDDNPKILLQFPALREFGSSGKPIWGTCAGLIFLADRASGES